MVRLHTPAQQKAQGTVPDTTALIVDWTLIEKRHGNHSHFHFPPTISCITSCFLLLYAFQLSLYVPLKEPGSVLHFSCYGGSA